MPIASVSKADGLPKPKVTASVRRASGGGRSRVLSYKTTPVAGQTVTFAEEGRGGVGAPIGKATSAAAGTLRFVPASGPGGTRKVVATGQPARDAAGDADRGALRRARPAQAGAAEGPGEAIRHASWWCRGAPTPASRRFIARVALSDGRVLMAADQAPRVTIPAIAKATTATITVAARTAAASPARGRRRAWRRSRARRARRAGPGARSPGPCASRSAPRLAQALRDPRRRRLRAGDDGRAPWSTPSSAGRCPGPARGVCSSTGRERSVKNGMTGRVGGALLDQDGRLDLQVRRVVEVEQAAIGARSDAGLEERARARGRRRRPSSRSTRHLDCDLRVRA